MDKKEIIGNRIQKLRKSKGLTQTQLAREIGLSMFAIRNYENGLREPNSKAMVALEQYFGVSGAYLHGETDETGLLDWEDVETSAGVGSELHGLLQFVDKQLTRASPEMQKLAYDLLVELKHLLKQSDPTIQTAGAQMMAVYLLQWNTYIDALERKTPETQASALQQAMDELCPRATAKGKTKPPAQT